MYISHAEIEQFRALEAVSVPLNQFSVLIGENDVGKTSFLYALDRYFAGKKLSDVTEWFRGATDKDIRIILTFRGLPEEAMGGLRRQDGSVVISKVFPYDKAPKVTAILDDESAVEVPPGVLRDWFSSDSFVLIPVRRDLAVQFSMNKTALLGKMLRAKMKDTFAEGGAAQSLQSVEDALKTAIAGPRERLEKYLQEQMHNAAIKLGFDALEVDPVEGVSFIVRLSDDRVDDILIQNRGAGTQNNLVIALFRLIADLGLGKYFIFAMEEPENSLHPKAQRQLLSVIQEISERSQVIVTTHCPVFIDRSKFEHNIILTRSASGNTVAKRFDASIIDEVRTDLGIRASDALLKGGGNCAVLVEGSTEEDGFPIFMEMFGVSEFQLGIAVINMRGSDFAKVSSTARLLRAYDIPCVIVLDKDAEKTAGDLLRAKDSGLPNIREVFRLTRGTIEDYYPLDIVAAVINAQFAPKVKVVAADFDAEKHGRERLADFKKVMYEKGAGDSLEYLKRALGGLGTRMMRDDKRAVDPELGRIFDAIKAVATEA